MVTNEHAVAELSGTVLQPAAAAMHAQTLQLQEAAVDALGSRMIGITQEERWLWARSAILTRAGIVSSSSSDSTAIVPLIDFANCSTDPTAECQPGPHGEVNLVAKRDIPARTEVTISYGEQNQEQ